MISLAESSMLHSMKIPIKLYGRVVCLPVISHPVLSRIEGDREYVLMSGQVERRFVGDQLEHARMQVMSNGKVLANLFYGNYGDKISVSMSPIRWDGPISRDYYDNRFHDFGPLDSAGEAFVAATKACEIIFEYRKNLF